MDTLTPAQSLNPEQILNPLEQTPLVSALKQPFEKKPKLPMWKIGILLVLCVALVSTVIFFLYTNNSFPLFQKASKNIETSSTAEETAPIPAPNQTWETYTNTKNHFSLDYPSDWSKAESPSGNGVTFKPLNSQNTPGVTDDITVYVGPKTPTEEELTFEEYAKVAAIQEIQNYNELASSEPITLQDGTVGYKTTWMVQSISNHQAPEESESAPITYFQIPDANTHLLRISSGHDVDSVIYDHMIKSLVFAPTEKKISVASPIPTPIPTPILTPTPAVDEEAILKTTIKEQILAVSPGNGGTLNVSVSQIIGDYAKGIVSDDEGGGLWFAAKVNGDWKLVWDGNGILTCSDLTDYPDFSKVLIPECYDPATEQSVKR